MTRDAARRFTAELLGSALLAALVVGSGIAAQRLSPDDVGLQLLENAFATALGLPRSDLVLLAGEGSRSKVVSARGITPTEAARRLGVEG